MDISSYIRVIYEIAPSLKNFKFPWEITEKAEKIIRELIQTLGSDYRVKNDIAIHKTARVSDSVSITAPAIIGKNCFIAASACLRKGVFLDQNVVIGSSCEIKSSFIFRDSSVAHLNYVGNSIIGSGVNLEAGSIIANHYNEREDKEIAVVIDGKRIKTGVDKFGALIGDNVKIGANAVLSPGTTLRPGSVVNRLELVKQS